MNKIDTKITSNAMLSPNGKPVGGTGRVQRVPCVLMRGGTSRGPFFLENDIPVAPEARDEFLLTVMGSPHQLQVDGLGGANPLTSKVAIIAKSEKPGVDVEYLFAQVAVEKPIVDTGPNCGNMLSAVEPFAIEQGIVPAQDGETIVRIFNRNTSSLVEAVIQTPGGFVEYEGDTAIDGVNGTAACIRLSFGDAAGGKTGALFSTGKRRESIDGVDVTLIDYAMPMMLLAASDVGLDGAETPAEIDANTALFERLEKMRMEAGRRMGLGDVTGSVIPKIGLLSRARKGGTITSRYLVPDSCHRSHSATGALCVAAASRMEGTVAFDLAAQDGAVVNIEHPGGKIPIALTAHADGVSRAEFVRTARRIFEGNVLVSSHLFATT